MTIIFTPPSEDDIRPSIEIDNVIYLRSEDDLPNQTATTWTMDTLIPYKLADTFSTSKQCIPATGCVLFGDSMDGHILTFTGSADDMFLGTDVNFDMYDIGIDAGITKTCFNFTDTVGGAVSFRANQVRVYSANILAKFTDLALAQILNSNCRNVNTRGLQFFGTTLFPTIWSIEKLALISTNPLFKAVDLGVSQALIQEFTDLFCFAPVGAVGFSGLANSGNVPVGRLMRIYGCEFLGGMTDLENLNEMTDVRIDFQGNFPTANTQPDALISFVNNALETEITTIDTPVKINAVWLDAKTPSLFNTDSSGSVTSLSERPINTPIDLSLGLVSVGGGTKLLTVYIYVDGIQEVSSGVQIEVSGNNPKAISLPWQSRLLLSEVVDVYIENNTDTNNIIATNGIMRIK